MDADKVDKLPGALAGGFAKLSSVDTEPGDLTFSPVDVAEQDAAASTIAHAQRSLARAGVAAEDFDPSFAEIVGAEFRRNNIVASVLSSRSLAQDASDTDDSRALTHTDIIQKVEEGNLQPYFEYFKGARSENEFEAIRADLERELQDQRIQAASGWTGTFVGMGAAVLDLPSLLPGSIALKALSKAPGVLRTAAEVGAGGLAFGVASEAGLQSSQVTRTADEAVVNIGASTILGAAIGGSVHAIVGTKAANKIFGRFDETRADAANGYPKAQAVGAQTSGDIYEQAAARGLDDDDRLFSGGAFAALEKLGDIPVLGDYLRNPRLDSERSPSSVVRGVLESLSDTASITKRNAGIGTPGGENVAAQDSAQALIGKYTGQFAQASKEVNDIFVANKAAYSKGRPEFNSKVARALANGEQFADPTITKAAKILREQVFEPIRQALVAHQIFTDDPTLKNAIGYFPVVYDSEAIKATKNEFIEFHIGAFKAELQDEVRQALVSKGIKASDVEDAAIQNFGVRQLVPKVDEAGAPVLNPKTGKQVMTAEVVAPGTVREAREQLHKEADREISRTMTDRDGTLEAFDKGAPSPAPIANDAGEIVSDFRAQFAEREKIVDERVNVTGTRDDKLSDIAAERQQKIDAVDEAYRVKNIETKLTRDQKKIARLERDKARDKINTATEKRAKDVNAAAQKELDKLDARLKRTREEITDVHSKRIEQLRKERDARVAEAVEQGRSNVATARGVDLPEGHATLLNKYARGGKAAEDLIEKEAFQRAEALYRSVTGQGRYTFSHELSHKSLAGYAKARSNPAYHTDLMDKGWVLTDAMDAAEKYSKTAGTDAAIGSIFKKAVPKVDDAGKVVKDANGKVEMNMVGDPLMTDAISRIKKDWNDNILANVTAPKDEIARLTKKYGKDPAKLEEELNKARAKAENKLLRQRDRDVSNIETLLAFARGTSLSQTPQSIHRAAELFGIFNFVTKMGGTVISSLGDPINIALSQGFGNAARHGVLPLITDFRAAYLNANGDLRRLSRLAGANVEMEFGARLAAMGDLGSVYASRDPLNPARKIAETFGKVAGITYWNSFLKQVSYNTIQARIITNAVEGFEKLSPSERAWMASLGVDAKRSEAFRQQFLAQSQKSAANVPVAHWDTWADKEAGEAFRSAVYRENVNNVITPTMSDRVAFSASPYGRMILQFRNFMIANQMRLIGRNVQLASLDKEKAANVYTGLFGLTMMAAMIDATKRIISNSDVEGSLADESQWQRYVTEWKEKPGQQMYNTLDRAGHFGVLFEGSNILDKLGLPSIQGGMRMATGEDIDPLGGTSRTKNVSVLGSAFGPTVGALDDLAGAAGTLTKAGAHAFRGFTGSDADFETPFEFSRGDYKRIQRIVPGNTIFYLRPIMNTGQRAVGNYFEWPDPK